MTLLKPVFFLACLALPAALAAADAHAGLVFSPPSHDFGRIPPVRKVSHTFRGINTSKATLRILQVQPGCGCTSAVLGKSEVAPGGAVEVQVTFDPGTFTGPVNKSVVLHVDDPARPIQTLSFQADVFRPLELLTRSLVLDDIPRNAGGRGEARIRSRTGLPPVIKGLEVPPRPYLEATLRMEGLEAVVEITLYGDRIPAGVWRGADEIRVLAADPDAGPLAIGVYWTVKDAPSRTKP